MDTNEELRMSRHGGADPDGNQPGDLYVVIKVKIKLQLTWRLVHVMYTRVYYIDYYLQVCIHKIYLEIEYLILVYMYVCI